MGSSGSGKSTLLNILGCLDRVLTARHLPHLFATYPTGGHGYGMKDTPFTRSSGWQERLWSWLVATGMGR